MNNLGLVTKYEIGFLEHVLPLIWVRTENIITLVHSLTDLTLIFLLPLFFISLPSKKKKRLHDC